MNPLDVMRKMQEVSRTLATSLPQAVDNPGLLHSYPTNAFDNAMQVHGNLPQQTHQTRSTFRQSARRTRSTILQALDVDKQAPQPNNHAQPTTPQPARQVRSASCQPKPRSPPTYQPSSRIRSVSRLPSPRIRSDSRQPNPQSRSTQQAEKSFADIEFKEPPLLDSDDKAENSKNKKSKKSQKEIATAAAEDEGEYQDNLILRPSAARLKELEITMNGYDLDTLNQFELYPGRGDLSADIALSRLNKRAKRKPVAERIPILGPDSRGELTNGRPKRTCKRKPGYGTHKDDPQRAIPYSGLSSPPLSRSRSPSNVSQPRPTPPYSTMTHYKTHYSYVRWSAIESQLYDSNPLLNGNPELLASVRNRSVDFYAQNYDRRETLKGEKFDQLRVVKPLLSDANAVLLARVPKRGIETLLEEDTSTAPPPKRRREAVTNVDELNDEQQRAATPQRLNCHPPPLLGVRKRCNETVDLHDGPPTKRHRETVTSLDDQNDERLRAAILQRPDGHTAPSVGVRKRRNEPDDVVDVPPPKRHRGTTQPSWNGRTKDTKRKDEVLHADDEWDARTAEEQAKLVRKIEIRRRLTAELVAFHRAADRNEAAMQQEQKQAQRKQRAAQRDQQARRANEEVKRKFAELKERLKDLEDGELSDEAADAAQEEMMGDFYGWLAGMGCSPVQFVPVLS